MSFKERNKSLIDTLSTIFLTTLALIFSLKVFPLAIFLFPIPFIVLGINYNIKNTIIGFLISSLILGLALDIYSGILMLVLLLPFTIATVYMIKKDYKPGRILLIGSLVFIITLLILVVVGSKAADINFVDKADEIFKLNFESQIELLKGTGIGKADLAKIEETLDIVRENILVTMPSIFIILSIALTYINYLISTIILRKDGYELRYRPIFSKFKLPRSIFLGSLIMFIFSYIFNKLNILNGQGLIRNLVVLVTFIFSIQGLSVLDFLMKKRGMKTFGRVFTIIFLVFLPPLGSLMSFVGVLDTLVDFRKPKIEK